MASLIEELVATLKEQKTNYEELLILTEEKAKVVKANDIATLTQITSAETVIVGKNQKLDTKREGIVNNIGIVLNHNAEDLTLTKIAEIITNEDEKEEIRQLRDELKEILNTLKLRNNENKVLIETSLDHIEFTVNLLRNQEATGLNPDGTLIDNRNLFDAKG